MSNPLKLDPTRTTTLQRSFIKAIRRRLTAFKKELRRMLVTEDSFGLTEKTRNPLGRLEQYQFLTDSEKLAQFKKWVEEKLSLNLLEVAPGETAANPWTAEYINSAYLKGVERGYIETNKPKFDKGDDFYNGTKAQFLRDSFNGPIAVEKLKQLNTRVFEGMKGINDDISSQMNRIFADGLLQGKNAKVIGADLARQIDSIDIKRGRTIARTEIIRAHAEGALDSYERLGVEELGLQAEWLHAGDDLVCAQCLAAAEDGPYKIEDARGLIPLHPNCRCTWIPIDAPDSKLKGVTRNTVLFKQRRYKSLIDVAV